MSEIRSVLSAQQFSKSQLLELMRTSRQIEERLGNERQIPLLSEFVLATMFFEPSTRTRLSFESAMHRLGGRVITSVGVQFSSLAKGESLYDTLKMMEGYADICVIRHPMEGASVLAAQNISIPVINGGDGAGEHPTQGLLDVYTIQKHRDLENERLVVAFVGDIKYGRTIHSLIILLSHFDVEFLFISPKELGLPDKYREILQQKQITFSEVEDIESIYRADFGYITRIQEERFVDHKEYERFKDSYVIDRELLQKCKPEIKIMHPLPRLSEVSTDIDELPQALYFEQAENGLFVRAALLLTLLGKALD